MTTARLTYRVTKRVFDVCGAVIALLLLAPVLAAICVCLRLEDPRAPVLFRQFRAGYGGRRFELLKFRTMVKDAEKLKESLRGRSVVAWPDFRLPDDPRVTRLGRFLRRTSLDELPQLVNVLRGDMSLVGPRPTSFDASTYTIWQTARLDYLPGITGPWQVDGRDSMDFTERCRLEISFFRRHSLTRELALVVRTASCVVKRSGVA
jgi:lipopolysaccharide/colanic/teichoic acid biosynthesis glycosyltransferase